jgi:hypothetical protein
MPGLPQSCYKRLDMDGLAVLGADPMMIPMVIKHLQISASRFKLQATMPP